LLGRLKSRRFWSLFARGDTAFDGRPSLDERPGSRSLAAGAELAVEATAAEVVGAFRSAGIRTVLLKGASLGRWLYDANSTRASIDVDLLIAPRDRIAAETVLSDIGFSAFPSNVAGEDNRHARAWQRDLNPVGVDLHLNLSGVGVSNEDAWSVLTRDTDGLLVGGIELEILSRSARAMHVALHAAQHGAQWEWGVKDLAQALDRLPLEVWQGAAVLAERLDATRPFAAGLRLLPSGQELTARLRLVEATTIEVALRSTTPPDLSLGLHRLASIAGMREKAAFVARKLFPPADWMRTWLPLARRGRITLAAAYVWRPIWVVLRMPAALRALRRARRESGKSG
jgi:hypothetical protein